MDCAHCNRPNWDHDEDIEMTAAPQILILQLQIITPVPNNPGQFNKITQPNTYPEHLDMTPLVRPGVLPDGHSMRYTLSSVVAHQGNLAGGHYINIARGPGGIHKCDDRHITRTTRAEMLAPRAGFTPYILTYLAVDGTPRTKERPVKVGKKPSGKKRKPARKPSKTGPASGSGCGGKHPPGTHAESQAKANSHQDPVTNAVVNDPGVIERMQDDQRMALGLADLLPLPPGSQPLNVIDPSLQDPIARTTSNNAVAPITTIHSTDPVTNAVVNDRGVLERMQNNKRLALALAPFLPSPPSDQPQDPSDPSFPNAPGPDAGN